jgi:adenylate cyclase
VRPLAGWRNFFGIQILGISSKVMAEDGKFEIELEGDKALKVSADQTILDASLSAGIPHFHACGGNAECSTCRILVVEGMENLSPVNSSERELRDSVGLPANIRLACQTYVQGEPVKVRRIILDESDISLYIKEEIHNDDVKQLGDKRELVLFFLDIRNFTPFVEAYLPFDVIHVMRAVHKIFNYIIQKNKGIIIDTAGDGFYAVFGLETSIQEAADNAIKAGDAISRELRRFNDTYLYPHFNTKFEIGIGAHCGEVIVGEVMVGQKSHLSVMGLAVNIASRIQSSTKRLTNSFIVSDAVIKNSTLSRRGKKRMIKLKGIQGPFHVHLIGETYDSITHLTPASRH